MADAMVFFLLFLSCKDTNRKRASERELSWCQLPLRGGSPFFFISSTTTWICTCTIVGTWDI